MKYYKLIILLFLIVTQVNAQDHSIHDGYYCHIVKPEADKTLRMESGSSSTYGNIHTPKGALKVLIICAGFGPTWDNMGVGGWATGPHTFPDNLQPSNPALIYNNVSSFSNPANTSKFDNISNFYYQMSMQSFQLYGDIYPTRINIDPTGATGWGEMNRRVMQQMKTIDTTFDWSPYDQRTNRPGYSFDNSVSAPDNKPDYIIIVYRYTSTWATQPVAGMNNWPGSMGGYAAADGLGSINYNGYTFDGSGFTACIGGNYGLFIHEFAHTLYDCPHYGGANGVTGNYFEMNHGWGMMNLGNGAFNSALGWERWYLGWSDLICNSLASDIQTAANLPSNGEFILRDFVSSGDMVRITLDIPGTINDQYLWLENHKGSTVFDDRLWVINGCGQPFTPSPRGLVAYVTDIPYLRNNPSTSLVLRGNSVHYLHGIGNYDYSYTYDPQTPCHYWGNALNYIFKEDEPNSMGRSNRNIAVKSDYNSNGTIAYNSHFNGPGPGNEHQDIARRDNQYTFDNMMSDIPFPVSRKIGTYTNPPLVNVSTYNDGTKAQTPIFLNGITVTVLEQLVNGDVKIKIEYKDVNINTPQRWTGVIALPDIIPGAASDLVIGANNNIKLNQSRNAQRTTINPATGSFINPSSLELMAGSKMLLSNYSKLIVEEGSTLTLRANSILEIDNGAQLWIKKGSLILEAGAKVIVNGSGAVDISCTSSVCANAASFIQLNSSNSFFTLHNGSILTSGCVQDLNTIKTGLGLVKNYITLPSAQLVINNTTYNTNKTEAAYNILANNNNQVNNPAWVIYSGGNEVQINTNFNVAQGAQFEIRTSNATCP